MKPEELEERSRQHVFYKDPRGCPYGVADRMALQIGTEWRLLTILCCINPYGHCDMAPWRNSEWGYEDDVFLTRGDNQSEPGPLTFIFKPSGYSMAWYKYYWRPPEQSENLSIGEIRRIFRLCVEHILFKREVPRGTTRELLSLPIHVTEFSDDIRDRVDRICRLADCNMMGASAIHFSHPIRHDRDGDDPDASAASIIESIQGPV